MARIRWGSAILAVGSLSLITVSFALVSRDADMVTAVGRHLWAGAAAWVACIPLFVYGVPIAIIDATHVPDATLVNTLAPQVAGLLTAVIGIGLAASGIRAKGPQR